MTTILDAQMTALYKRLGAFYAFSRSQLNEKRIEGVKYVSLFGGLICPKDNVDELMKQSEIYINEEAKREYEEKGVDRIISHAYFNYETQITGDTTDAEESLEIYVELYPDVFTPEKIRGGFAAAHKQAVENDWF